MKKNKKTNTVPAGRKPVRVGALFLAALIAGGLLLPLSGCSEKDPAESSAPESTSLPSSSEASEPEIDDRPTYTPEVPFMNEELGVLDEFTDLYTANPDFVGYLRVDGTPIDTPVVQAKDNSYYLNRNFEKASDPYGVPYADFRAQFSKDRQSDNVTIYGHSTRDGELFGAVKAYSDIEYYKEHPYLTFDTIYGKNDYKIVGMFLARVYTDASKPQDPEEFNYHMFVDAEGNAAQFNNFMDGVYARSYWYNEDVDVSYGDKLITLSTCDSDIHEFGAPTEYRCVLVARRIRQGEVIEVDVEKAKINEDMLMPKAWQDKFGKENPYK